MDETQNESGSQVTLVNTSLLNPLELLLDKSNSVLNTRLLVDSRPRYNVSTLDRDGNDTDVKDIRTGEVLAMIRRRFFRSDTVRFPGRFGGEKVKKDEWLTRRKGKNSLCVPSSYQAQRSVY